MEKVVCFHLPTVIHHIRFDCKINYYYLHLVCHTVKKEKKAISYESHLEKYIQGHIPHPVYHHIQSYSVMKCEMN